MAGKISWSVGIISSPRMPDTLTRCVASLSLAGFPTPHIFAEPETIKPTVDNTFYWHQRGVVHGAWPNWLSGLMQLSQINPEASHYLMLEDDALLYDGNGVLQKYLEQSLPTNPGIGFCSMYCAEAFCPKEQGWVRCNLGYYFLGALALVFSRSSIESILLNSGLLRHRREEGKERGGKFNDCVLGQWALDSGLSVYVHHPSLVEHIGEFSTIGNEHQPKHVRQARSYVGGDGEMANYWRKRINEYAKR